MASEMDGKTAERMPVSMRTNDQLHEDMNNIIMLIGENESLKVVAEAARRALTYVNAVDPRRTRPAEPEGKAGEATPKPGQLWQHHTGLLYRILCIANEHGTKPKYTPTVVYEGMGSGLLWARPLSDWHRSFTPKEAAGDE